MEISLILIISSILLIILCTILIYLRKVERDIAKDIKSASPKRINDKYQEKLNKITKLKNEEEKIKRLVIFAKQFIKERYEISQELDFSELSKMFYSEGKTKISNFCEKMSYYHYSNKKDSKKQIPELFSLMKQIIDESIPVFHSQKKLDSEKKQQKDKPSKNIKKDK